MVHPVLIVDDEEKLRGLLGRIISLEGFPVTEAGSIRSALDLLQQRTFDVVLCDVRLPDGNGVDFVQTLRSRFPMTEIILLTAFGHIADGVKAIKYGAFDYLVKGNDNDRIIPLLHQAIDQVSRRRAAAVKVDKEPGLAFDSIIGSSQALHEAIALARKVAVTDTAVLLLGETGTGKEVFANAIHQASKRRDHAFVALNCSAFNRELLEGELFGYKAGAFTGAARDKKGIIEVAEGGTVFLDEIGEMPAELQARLLRFLDSGEYIRLGDTKIARAHVRIIAATNRRLEEEISRGRFRSDLYYRLNAFTIQLPPLRERKEDIEALAENFLGLFAAKEGMEKKLVHPRTLQLLQTYSWKGNIRELKHVMERAAIIAAGKELLPEDLPFEIQQQDNRLLPALSLAAIEKQHIEKILQYNKGNKTKSARILDIGLATLYRKMEEYGISQDFSK